MKTISERRLELCKQIDTIAKEGIWAKGYFTRQAPLWAELAYLGRLETHMVQGRLFEKEVTHV